MHQHDGKTGLQHMLGSLKYHRFYFDAMIYPSFVILRFDDFDIETPTMGRLLRSYSTLDEFLPQEAANAMRAARALLWADRPMTND